MHIQELYPLFLQNPSVQTDTRLLKSGDIFFALKGPNFNANLFAHKALDAGAAYAIVEEYNGPANQQIIKVDDVLNTLQQLAKHHRQRFTCPFIAITGSNGKTTTKELVHEVLSSTYKTYTTQGNLNNHIGIPLTILKIKEDAEIAIIEMGANHQKEIEGYCNYTRPTHGLITNCGKAHLEGFGGVDGVLKGKGELFVHLRENEGTAFVMWDYDYLREMSNGIKKIIKYGTREADITGEIKSNLKFIEVRITKGAAIDSIKTKLAGDYNLPNVLAAVTLGKFFSVTDEKIRKSIENYNPSNSRSQVIEINNNQIVLDAYNANPSSMKAAIENFAKMPGHDKILMLGGMMELGVESISEHQSLINLIQQYKWKNVVLVGGDFNKSHHPFIYFINSIEAGEWYRQQHFKNTYILIKGSRSIQMEKILS